MASSGRCVAVGPGQGQFGSESICAISVAVNGPVGGDVGAGDVVVAPAVVVDAPDLVVGTFVIVISLVDVVAGAVVAALVAGAPVVGAAPR